MQAHTDKQLDTENVSDDPYQLNPNFQEMPRESTGPDFRGNYSIENQSHASPLRKSRAQGNTQTYLIKTKRILGQACA